MFPISKLAECWGIQYTGEIVSNSNMDYKLMIAGVVDITQHDWYRSFSKKVIISE